MTREQKIRKDGKALKKYEKRLRNEKKVYSQTFEVLAINQRKSRELALGTCALQALDKVRELNKVKPLIGELYFNIGERKEQDAGGRDVFHCSVTFHVMSDEAAHDPEDIKKEIEQTFERMMRETDEMFPGDEDGKTEYQDENLPGDPEERGVPGGESAVQ